MVSAARSFQVSHQKSVFFHKEGCKTDFFRGLSCVSAEKTAGLLWLEFTRWYFNRNHDLFLNLTREFCSANKSKMWQKKHRKVSKQKGPTLDSNSSLFGVRLIPQTPPYCSCFHAKNKTNFQVAQCGCRRIKASLFYLSHFIHKCSLNCFKNEIRVFKKEEKAA